LSTDAEGVDVHDFIERLLLAAHLLVDAVQVLLAAHHLALQPFALEAGLQRFENAVEQLLAVAPGVTHGAVNQHRAHRVHGLEAEIFKLGAQAVHAQTVGDWRVDLQGFLGDASAFFRRQCAEGAHVVQAVGQLDQNHADVAGHRQRHFLEVFGLRFGLGLEGHLGQLADPVHQLGDGIAELLDQCVLRNAGVFNHVMQHGGHQALMVHVHVGKDVGYRKRVGNVGLAAAAGLPVMSLLGVEIGAPDQVDLLRLKVVTQVVGKYFYRRHAALPHPPARVVTSGMPGLRNSKPVSYSAGSSVASSEYSGSC